MGSNRKPDAPRAAGSEPKTLQANQPPKPFLATSEGITRTSKAPEHPMGAIANRVTARLGPSLHVKGEISGNEDLLIDDTVEGLIQLDEQKLMIGGTGKVTADIIAGEVVVGGNVKGNVRAKRRIEIKRDGSVSGDLTTAQIMIEDGAYFERFDRNRQGRGENSRPARLLAGSSALTTSTGSCGAEVGAKELPC